MMERWKELLTEARAIARKAEDEDRGLTPAEELQCEELILQAKKARQGITPRDTQKAADAAVVKQISDLTAGTSLMRGDGSPRQGGAWSKAFREHLSRRADGRKELLSPTGSVAVPAMSSTIVTTSDPVSTMLSLIPREIIETDGYSYLREDTRTHEAAPVAVKGTKPTSVYELTKVDDTVETIAHLSEQIPRQYLADMALLGRYLDSTLREGLRLELEYQVLQGDGNSPNLKGILSTPGIMVQAFDTDGISSCRRAITLLELASIVPGGFVLNPSDWETMELLTDEGSAYKLGNQGNSNQLPLDRAKRRLWGLPVALSVGCPAGTGILADFSGSTYMWERESATVDWSENIYDSAAGVTDFVRNLIRFRAEMRAGFAVLRPVGVVEIALEVGS